MKTKGIKINIYRVIILVCGIITNMSQTFAQERDTLAYVLSSHDALQFQLIGGIGVYYNTAINKDSHIRIGADVNLNHSDLSGDESSYSIYIRYPVDVKFINVDWKA